MGLSSKGLWSRSQCSPSKDTQSKQCLYLHQSGKILFNLKHLISTRQKGHIVYHTSAAYVLLQTIHNSQHYNSCGVRDGSTESYKTNCIPNLILSSLHTFSLSETLIFKVITLTQLYPKREKRQQMKNTVSVTGKTLLIPRKLLCKITYSEILARRTHSFVLTKLSLNQGFYAGSEMLLLPAELKMSTSCVCEHIISSSVC